MERCCLSHDTDNPERAWNLGNWPQNKLGSKASDYGSAPLCVFISYLHSFSLTWSQNPGMHLFISKLKNNKWKNAIKEESAPKTLLPSMWIPQQTNLCKSLRNVSCPMGLKSPQEGCWDMGWGTPFHHFCAEYFSMFSSKSCAYQNFFSQPKSSSFSCFRARRKPGCPWSVNLSLEVQPCCGLGCSKLSTIQRIMESFQLEKPSKIIESNH